MLKQEILHLDDGIAIKTYSDNGKYILQIETGIKYGEAIDIPNKYTYIETNEDIPIETNEDIPIETNEDIPIETNEDIPIETNETNETDETDINIMKEDINYV